MPIIDPDKIIDPDVAPPGGTEEAFKGVVSQMGTGERLGAGTGYGLLGVYRAINERALEIGKSLGITDPARLENLRKTIADEALAFKPLGETTAGAIGKFVGEMAPTLAIPGGVTGGVVKRGLTSAAAGAATAALEPGASPLSVAGGAALAAGGSAGMTFVGKLYNAIRGNLIPKYQELIDLGKKHGVRVSVGDITANPNVQRGEVLLEHVPLIGMEGFRAGQNPEADQAVRRFMGQFGSGTLNENEKKIQESLLGQLKKNKMEVDKLYNDFYAEAQKVGAKVDMTQTRTAVNDLLSFSPDLFRNLPDQSLQTKLEALRTGLQWKQPLDPADVAFIRKKLNNYMTKAEKQVGAVGDEEIHHLTAVKKALQTDLDQFAATHPNTNVVKLYKDANKAYQDKVVPYKDTIINKTTRQNYDADVLFQQFIKKDRVNLAGKLESTIAPSDKDIIKYSILRYSYDLASPDKTGKAVFSPKTFATEIKKLNEVNKKIFNPQEMQELQGVTNLMEHAARSGQFMEKPPTGYRLVPLSLIGLGAYGMAGKEGMEKYKTMSAEVAFIGGLTLALTTPVGRNLLLSASRIQPGSPQMNFIMNQVYNQAAKVPVIAYEEIWGGK